MVLMSAKIQAKTEMGQEQVEVDETVQNHAAPASEPAITNGTASGKPQLESKNALDRIAKDLRDISGEGESTFVHPKSKSLLYCLGIHHRD